ncbi:PAS domain S-box protein, partial [bacterium]|nr:PAS domain S-box protein [candidate division CSSED10-310 bacterium]
EKTAIELIGIGLEDYVIASETGYPRLSIAVKSILTQTTQKIAKAFAEERYRLLFDNVPMGLYRVTPSGKILDANEAFIKMLGYTHRDELTRLYASDLYLRPEERKRWTELLEAKGVVQNFDIQLKHAKGHTIWVRDSARAVMDIYGKIVAYEGSLQDITEQKTIEDELRKNERSLIRQNSVLVELAKRKKLQFGNLLSAFKIITEASAETLEVERTGIWVFNHDRSKIICKCLYEHSKNEYSEGMELSIKDFPKYVAAIENERNIAADDALNDERTKEFAEHYLKPYGINSMLDAPIRKSGKVIGIICHEHVGTLRQWSLVEQNFASSMADLAALIIEESARKLLEDHYQALIENIHDIILIVNDDDMIRYVSPSVERALGYKPDDFIGKTLTEHVHPDDAIRLTELTEKLKTEPGNAAYIDLQYKDLQGEWKWFEVILKNLLLNPVVQGIIVNARDVTLRQKAEQEKKRIQEQLLQSQKLEAIGTLSGGIAHDFNNLLTTIQGFSELVMMDLGETHPSYSDIKNIHNASLKASALTRKLLLFSRKQRLTYRLVNVNVIIEDLLKMLSRLIGEDIKVELDLASDLWTVKADPGTLEQVIMNISLNARDAMPCGGHLKIKTYNVIFDKLKSKLALDAREGPFVCISIRDDGSGMNEAILQHIFEPFFTTKDEKGTGLGLSVAYGIIKEHNGWINVYSEMNQGSLFNIYLPAEKIISETEDTITVVSSDYRGNGEKILLVEDENEILSLVSRVLETNNYTTFSTADAKQALEIFQKHNGDFDLIFSDVVLSDTNGLDLISLFNKQKPSIPILLTSGYADKKSQWPLIKERGYSFLQKPYSLNDLLHAITSLLREKN